MTKYDKELYLTRKEDPLWVEEHSRKAIKYYYEHREECLARHKAYMRRRITESKKDGKRVYILADKRPYPPDMTCEVCEGFPKTLVYHHWQPPIGGKLVGMWLCQTCHKMAHGAENGHVNKYKNLKREQNLRTDL